MCGGCGSGPLDDMAALVAGPRRRAAIAVAAAEQAPGLRIRVVDRAWTVTEQTGRVTVCRTVRQLVDVLERRGIHGPTVLSAMLGAAESAPAPS